MTYIHVNQYQSDQHPVQNSVGGAIPLLNSFLLLVLISDGFRDIEQHNNRGNDIRAKEYETNLGTKFTFIRIDNVWCDEAHDPSSGTLRYFDDNLGNGTKKKRTNFGLAGEIDSNDQRAQL